MSILIDWKQVPSDHSKTIHEMIVELLAQKELVNSLANLKKLPSLKRWDETSPASIEEVLTQC